MFPNKCDDVIHELNVLNPALRREFAAAADHLNGNIKPLLLTAVF
jgi:hypothetical protein